MINKQDILSMVHAVAAIVQQQGQHDFPSYDFESESRTAVLCGLTVEICNGQLTRIKARDMEIAFDIQPLQAANDEQIARFPDQPSPVFMQGSYIELERWHHRLTRFQNVFRFTPYVAANRDEVA